MNTNQFRLKNTISAAMNSDIDSMTSERLAHQAANEALSIAMGVQMLQTISDSSLSEKQRRAMQILEISAERLVHLVDAMKSKEMVYGTSEADEL